MTCEGIFICRRRPNRSETGFSTRLPRQRIEDIPSFTSKRSERAAHRYRSFVTSWLQRQFNLYLTVSDIFYDGRTLVRPSKIIQIYFQSQIPRAKWWTDEPKKRIYSVVGQKLSCRNSTVNQVTLLLYLQASMCLVSVVQDTGTNVGFRTSHTKKLPLGRRSL